jgi:hypothetical protein
LNLHGSPPKDSIKISIKIEELGLKDGIEVRNLWAKKDIGEYIDEIFSIR